MCDSESSELQAENETIKDNEKKIKQNKMLPYPVSNIIEVLEVNPEDEEEIEGANVDQSWFQRNIAQLLEQPTDAGL